MVYDRWVVEENWQIFRGVVLGQVPALVRPIIAPIARRGVKGQLKGHGTGSTPRTRLTASGGETSA